MKKDIHPKYYDCTVEGVTIQTPLIEQIGYPAITMPTHNTQELQIA